MYTIRRTVKICVSMFGWHDGNHSLSCKGLPAASATATPAELSSFNMTFYYAEYPFSLCLIISIAISRLFRRRFHLLPPADRLSFPVSPSSFLSLTHPSCSSPLFLSFCLPIPLPPFALPLRALSLSLSLSLSPSPSPCGFPMSDRRWNQEKSFCPDNVMNHSLLIFKDTAHERKDLCSVCRCVCVCVCASVVCVTLLIVLSRTVMNLPTVALVNSWWNSPDNTQWPPQWLWMCGGSVCACFFFFFAQDCVNECRL